MFLLVQFNPLEKESTPSDTNIWQGPHLVARWGQPWNFALVARGCTTWIWIMTMVYVVLAIN